MLLKGTLLAVFVLFSSSFCLYGQNEEELADFQRFFEMNPKKPLEQSLAAATLKLEQANEINDPRERALALKHLGLIHLNGSYNYEQAMDLFIRSLKIEDSLNLESQQALTYVAIARVFEIVGDFYKSAQFLRQALVLNSATRDINSLAMILINLGNVNASMGKMDEALDNYQQVLRYRDDIGQNFEAEALFHLARLYTRQGSYREALKNHKRALALTRIMGDRYAEATSLNDIGILYGLMKNDKKSFDNHLVALEIRQSLKDKRGIAESHNSIGWLYYKQKELDKAIANGVLALENGRESQAQDQMFKSYELLSQAYKDLGDFENALTYKELSLAIHEFIQNEKHERELLETQNRYLLGKKETQIEALEALRIDREKEIAAQVKFRNFLFLLVGLILVIALLVLYLYLVKRRSNRILEVAKNEVQQQNSQLQELNHTKDKFFSIISHDLKGPLNSLTSFSHLLIEHTDHLSPQEIQSLAKDLDKSLKNLFTLLENLLAWSRSQTGNIDFTGEVFNLSELLISNKQLLDTQSRNKNIGIELDIPGECQVKLHRESINTVVRNLMSNAIKFTPEGGTIRAGIKTEKARLHVFVADNGVGISQDVIGRLFRIDTKHSTEGTASEKGTGLGLILCKEFVEKNGGRITVRSEPGRGSVFSLIFDEICLTTRTDIKEPACFP